MKHARTRLRTALAAAAIVTASLTAAGAAQADIEPLAVNGVYYISPKHAPTKCITVHGGSSAPGAIINQYRCIGREYQQWILTNGGIGPGIITLVNKYTGQCMVVNQASTVRGARITQAVCNSGVPKGQQFAIIGYESQMLTQTARDRCVGVEGGSTLDGARLIQWNCNGSLNQKWIFKRV